MDNTTNKPIQTPAYDVVMIGAGPSALAAAVYTTRENLQTVLYEKAVIGGLAAITDKIDNYPGFADGVAGLNLAEQLQRQAERFGAQIELGEVSSLRKDGNDTIVTVDGQDVRARAVLIATGSAYNKLGIPGEDALYGRGVHYCATCDGAFYKGKRLVVIGGGNSGLQEAMFLTRFAEHIDLLVRSTIKASEILQTDLQPFIERGQISVHLHTESTEIIAEDGKVTGVNVTIDGKEKTISAKAVVLTTGGFGANMQMVTEYNPALNGFVTTNQKGSTGDGVVLAKELGAATVDMKDIQIHPTVEQSTSTLISESVRGEGAILVNQEGKRFYNEMETRDKVSQQIIGLKEKYAYLIFDSALIERAKAVKFYEKRGLVKKADTIEALAKEINVPADALKATLETWNKAVADKNDSEFGRKTAMDHDLSKGPYYAIQIAPGIHHTMGGLKINTKAQVLKEDGSAIQGLYAAGEVTGGVHGENRIGGNAVADIIIFGRQAGAQSAAYAKEN